MAVNFAQVGQVASIGFLITVATSPLVLKGLRHHQIVDVPSERSSHRVTTPRGGGVACLLGLLGAVVFAPNLGVGLKALFLVSGVSLAALGLVDDLQDLSVRLRLAIQIGAAVLASFWAFNVSWPPYPAVAIPSAVGAIWIVAYVNVFNFMDGINGLAGAAAAVAGTTFVLVGVVRNDVPLAYGGAAEAGVALAFLPWNFPRAHFFLGDVGSYLFGGTVSLLVLIGLRRHVPFEALLGPEVIFVADTGWTLLCRISRGEDWTAPHRSHVYQRLQRTGTAHTSTTILIASLILGTAALGLVSLAGIFWLRLLADVTCILLVVAYLSSPKLLGHLVEARR